MIAYLTTEVGPFVGVNQGYHTSRKLRNDERCKFLISFSYLWSASVIA
jgi:hypothetical protein